MELIYSFQKQLLKPHGPLVVCGGLFAVYLLDFQKGVVLLNIIPGYRYSHYIVHLKLTTLYVNGN